MTNPYTPILIMMAVAGVMALGGVAASAVIGPMGVSMRACAARGTLSKAFVISVLQ